MPKEFDGLPLHPLVVHAVVVFIPLAALVAVLYLIPRWRRGLRWPMVVLALVALGATYLARESGQNFEETQVPPGSEDSPIGQAVERHEELANQLWYIVIAFAIVALIAAYVLRPLATAEATSEDVDDAGSTTLGAVVRGAMAALVIVGAVAVGVQTYRTGEQGSRAVWNPDDSIEYGIAVLE